MAGQPGKLSDEEKQFFKCIEFIVFTKPIAYLWGTLQ